MIYKTIGSCHGFRHRQVGMRKCAKGSGAWKGPVNYVSEKHRHCESDCSEAVMRAEGSPPKIHLQRCSGAISALAKENSKRTLLQGDVQLPQQLPRQRDLEKGLRKSPEKKTRENLLETHWQSLSRKHTISGPQYQSGGESLKDADGIFELGRRTVMPLGVPASTSAVYGINTYFLDAFWVLGIELGGGRS